MSVIQKLKEAGLLDTERPGDDHIALQPGTKTLSNDQDPIEQPAEQSDTVGVDIGRAKSCVPKKIPQQSDLGAELYSFYAYKDNPYIIKGDEVKIPSSHHRHDKFLVVGDDYKTTAEKLSNLKASHSHKTGYISFIGCFSRSLGRDDGINAYVCFDDLGLGVDEVKWNKMHSDYCLNFLAKDQNQYMSGSLDEIQDVICAS